MDAGSSPVVPAVSPPGGRPPRQPTFAVLRHGVILRKRAGRSDERRPGVHVDRAVGAVPGSWRQRGDLQVAGDRAGGCHATKAGEDRVALAQKGELVIFPVGRGPGVSCKRRTRDRHVLSLLRLNRGYGWVSPAEAPPGREALGAVALLGPLPRSPRGRTRAPASALSAVLPWFSGSPVTATGVWCVRPRPPAPSGLSLCCCWSSVPAG